MVTDAVTPATPATTGMVWGVKESFVRYVSASADGSIATHGRAGRIQTGRFYFEHDDAPRVAQEAESMRFRGAVTFAAHLGILSVRIEDPWIEDAPDGTFLTVARSAGDRRILARLQPGPRVLRGRILCWDEIEVRLHHEGVELFDETYAAGTLLDPMTVRVPMTQSAEMDPA